MKKIFSLSISAFLLIFSLPFFALSLDVSAQGMLGRVVDPGNYLADEENKRVTKKAQDAAYETGMNIIIYICDDVGYDKSDYGVMDLADVMYEEVCGIDTDGILLLINLDNKYDYISTSGVAINYFSDSRINSMFNWFTNDIEDGDFESACNNFVESVLYYYHQGKANHQSVTIDYEFDGMGVESSLMFFAVPLFITFIVGIIIYTINKNKYNMQKATTTKYIVSGSMLLNQRTDTYIGTVVNRVYSPRSSSSSGGGGGSHSSTHRSSGGGHHGGGGHHR